MPTSSSFHFAIRFGTGPMSKSFRDLIAFQRAVDLMACVYSTTAEFPRSEMYGLTSQLRRASVGVVSQIAEGQGRLSYGEWRQFLSQSRGSLFEVEAELIASQRLGFVTEEEAQVLTKHIRRTGRALAGLIKWVQRKEAEHHPRKPRDPETQ